MTRKQQLITRAILVDAIILIVFGCIVALMIESALWAMSLGKGLSSIFVFFGGTIALPMLIMLGLCKLVEKLEIKLTPEEQKQQYEEAMKYDYVLDSKTGDLYNQDKVVGNIHDGNVYL